MLDLTKRALPDTVMVDGRAFLLNTDFRVWLRFENDIKAGKDFDCTYLFKNEFPEWISVYDLMAFAHPASELPRKMHASDVISLDFKLDADYIFAAFMEQYGIDLMETDMHWHKFLALLNGLNEGTTLAKIMGYRNYKKSNDRKDPYDELRRAWEIIPELTEEEKKEKSDFEALFS